MSEPQPVTMQAWITTYPVNRPWGYSGAGAAKRWAALMAAWQRGVQFQ